MLDCGSFLTCDLDLFFFFKLFLLSISVYFKLVSQHARLRICTCHQKWWKGKRHLSSSLIKILTFWSLGIIRLRLLATGDFKIFLWGLFSIFRSLFHYIPANIFYNPRWRELRSLFKSSFWTLPNEEINIRFDWSIQIVKSTRSIDKIAKRITELPPLLSIAQRNVWMMVSSLSCHFRFFNETSFAVVGSCWMYWSKPRLYFYLSVAENSTFKQFQLTNIFFFICKTFLARK